MTDLSELTAAEVNGERVGVADALRQAKFAGRLQFLLDAVDGALVRQGAAKRGIEVTGEELQAEADRFRAERELFDAEATEAWLAGSRLSFADWESCLEERITARKLREALTAGKVEEHFAVNRLSFDEADISRIVVGDEGVAQELRAQIVDDAADFHALARRHSLDAATRPAGGYAGTVRRSDLEAAAEAAIFGAQPETVLGPFKEGREEWVLIKVDEVRRARLDEALRETIKERLFAEWLEEQRDKARLSYPLLQPVEDDS